MPHVSICFRFSSLFLWKKKTKFLTIESLQPTIIINSVMSDEQIHQIYDLLMLIQNESLRIFREITKCAKNKDMMRFQIELGAIVQNSSMTHMFHSFLSILCPFTGQRKVRQAICSSLTTYTLTSPCLSCWHDASSHLDFAK